MSISTKFALLPTITLIAIVAIFIMVGASSKGIVAHPSFEHGVAFCDGGKDKPRVDVEGVSHSWKSRGITYVVNWGHLQDEGVKHLQILANIHCPNFM